MAKQQGWLRNKKKYAVGVTWLFCFQTARQSDDKRVENSKRVGLVADFPTESAASMEVGRLGLQSHLDCSTVEPTFKQIRRRVTDSKSNCVESSGKKEPRALPTN
jgi:hypothetical protein